MKKLLLLFVFAATPVFAQNGPADQQPAPAPQQQPAQNAPAANAQPRVFLQAASKGNSWNAQRDQSMEMAKDFQKVCPTVKVTINQQNADYTVILITSKSACLTATTRCRWPTRTAT